MAQLVIEPAGKSEAPLYTKIRTHGETNICVLSLCGLTVDLTDFLVVGFSESNTSE